MHNRLQRVVKTGVAILAMAGIAAGACRAEPSAAQSPPVPEADLHINSWRQADFLSFDPQYAEKMATRIARARTLGKAVVTREIAGQNTQRSHQILEEIIWLISSTADFRQLDQRLDDLEASLAHPDQEKQADALNAADGSWGSGYTQWFFKLTASYSHMDQTASGYQYLARINSPQKLDDYLMAVASSDIARTGVDNEREFNESLSCFIRMILNGKPEGYAYDPGMKAALMDLLLHRLRNPETGYWGEVYWHDGHKYFVDDLSVTFHVVSYLNGEVPDMDKVVATTLALRNAEFPAGPVYHAERFDHLNMDVAELYRLGWAHADASQKKDIAADLRAMLQWCLTQSLQPDGSFKMWTGDNSKEESTYYGASFLARIGYFDKAKRFWTDEDFPEAEAVRQKIIGYIKAHQATGAAGGGYYRNALEQMGYKAKP